MLWRFRREIIFVLGLVLSLLVMSRSYVREFQSMEAVGPSEDIYMDYDELVAENIRLRKILDIKADKTHLRKFTVAEVLSIRPFVFPAEVIINRGLDDGLRENMAVLSNDLFLVGRIVAARRSTSSVMTVFSAKSKISVVTERTRDVGILTGGTVPYVLLEYIAVDSDVEIGDRVLTSGFSDFYPRGIEVGEIVKIEQVRDSLFLRIFVKPYGNFSTIYEVLAGA